MKLSAMVRVEADVTEDDLKDKKDIIIITSDFEVARVIFIKLGLLDSA